MSKWRTNYTNKKIDPGREMDQESIVDPLGFIPHNVKVNNYINAGINLAKARAEQYDADANVDPKDIPYNPFRDRGIDLVEQQRAKKKITDVIEAKIKAQKEAELKEQERYKKYLENERKQKEETAKNKPQESSQEG